jgi:hypothetical protein
LRGTGGIVLLSSWVWKDANGWALDIGISCTYSNPVITGGWKHTHTHLVGKRKDPPKVSSPEAKKLSKKKKEGLSDPPYVPPEEVHKTRSKNKSNCKKTLEEMGLEDGVVGAVNVSKEEYGVVISRILISYKLYEFMYCLESFVT